MATFSLDVLALDCAFLSAFVSTRLHAVGASPVDARPLAVIAGGLLIAGSGLLLMAKGA